MSQTRSYLVRREGREFIGPMLAEDFKQRLERLEFGMQDEVSGHCGPWVILDHRDDLAHYYPDLAQILGENLPLSWRESTGHARVLTKKDQKKERRNEFEEQKKSRTDFYRYMQLRKKQSQFRVRLALLTLLASVAAGVFIIMERDDSPSLPEVSALASKPDPADFLNTMGMKVIPQAAKIIKSPKLQPVWIPYVRMYAYFTTGFVEGVSQKTLRGDAPAAAPSDCSVDYWKRKWRENSAAIVSFLQGGALQKNPWTRLLAIDPEWLRRRPQKNWLRPKSYLEGCMMTAHTAMRSMSLDIVPGQNGGEAISTEISGLVMTRLKYQLEYAVHGKAAPAMALTGILSHLVCYETQTSLKELETCRQSGEQLFKPLLDERYALAVVRLLIKQSQVTLDKGLLGVVQTVLPRFVAEDFMSRFDMTPESKILNYVNSYGDIDQALSRIQEEYPDMEFK